MRGHPFFFVLCLACALPAQAEIFSGLEEKPTPLPAPKPAPSPKDQVQQERTEADYAQHLAAMMQPGSLLEKVRAWQNTAEANPQAIITLPPENPKDKAAKPRIASAKALAAHGITLLRQRRGELPKGANFSAFPLAVEIEVLHARALLLGGQIETAKKALEAIIGRDATPGTAEASVWLQAIRQHRFIEGIHPKAARIIKPDVVILPTWLGLEVDWTTGHPVFASPEVAQAQALLAADDVLVPRAQGEAQARAAVLTGDAYGLLGQWGEAQQAYGYAIALANYLSVPKYEIGQIESMAPRGVPSEVVNEARTKQIQARYIAEMVRLSAEFIFYRDGHGAMLRGDHAQAIAAFDKLLVLADKKRKDSRAKALAVAVADATKAKQSTDKAQQEAEATWHEGAEKNGMLESPFEAAAKVYRERCRLALGNPPSMSKAIGSLQAFIQQDTNGLYRGEAMWTLAQAAMDEGAFTSALPWLEKLDAWVKQTRAAQTKEGWNFATLLPGIAKAAGPAVAAPHAQYTAPDFWGHVSKQPIAPGQVVNEKTAPWYLNHLEEMAAKNLGFLQFVKGDYAAAAEQWKRVQNLNERCANIDQPFNHPNDCTRLLYAVKLKRIMAYPGEENLFASSFDLKARVLHAEFLHITQEFGRSVREFRDILAADDKLKAAHPDQAVGLSDHQRDYLWLMMGEAAFRAENADGFGSGATAFPCWEKVLEHISGTAIERRAALCYGNIGWDSKDPTIAKRARVLGDALLKSKSRDSSVCVMRLNQSLRLAQKGKVDEAIKMLEWFEKSDGKYYDMAQWRIKHGGRL